MKLFTLTVLSLPLLAGCQRSPRPAPPQPAAAAVPPRSGLRLTVRLSLSQGETRSELQLRCRLEPSDQGWRVSEIVERYDDALVPPREPFHAASPLAALGLPQHLLDLAGYATARPPRARERQRSVQLPVGGLRVPLRQSLRWNRTGGQAQATGSLPLGPEIDLRLRARSAWEDGVDPSLPRRLLLEIETVAQGGPGADATSRVELDVRAVPEVLE